MNHAKPNTFAQKIKLRGKQRDTYFLLLEVLRRKAAYGQTTNSIILEQAGY